MCIHETIERDTIEVASSNGKRRHLRRPLQKLFPLEVRETSVAEEEERARPIACTSERPRRQAAIEEEMRRRQVDQCLDESWARMRSRVRLNFAVVIFKNFIFAVIFLAVFKSLGQPCRCF